MPLLCLAWLQDDSWEKEMTMIEGPGGEGGFKLAYDVFYSTVSVFDPPDIQVDEE